MTAAGWLPLWSCGPDFDERGIMSLFAPVADHRRPPHLSLQPWLLPPWQVDFDQTD